MGLLVMIAMLTSCAGLAGGAQLTQGLVIVKRWIAQGGLDCCFICVVVDLVQNKTASFSEWILQNTCFFYNEFRSLINYLV